jgi:hypothetical protein
MVVQFWWHTPSATARSPRIVIEDSLVRISQTGGRELFPALLYGYVTDSEPVVEVGAIRSATHSRSPTGGRPQP